MSATTTNNKNPVLAVGPVLNPTLAARGDKMVTQKWELGVSCILNLWEALGTAVANNWGGPDSSDKRDWLCGEIADLYTNAKLDCNGDEEVDEFDVEDMLFQVMQDEFLVEVDDGSVEVVAREVQRLRQQVLRFDFAGVDQVYRKWNHRSSSRNVSVGAVAVRMGNCEDTDEGDQEYDSYDEDVEMEMGDGKPAHEQRGSQGRNENGNENHRSAPVVDDDGFELVKSRRRR